MNNSVVSPEESGLRLDLYLTRLLDGKSRNYAQKLIREGKCRVNGESVKDSYKVREGDRVAFDLLDEKPLDLVKKDIRLDILYQDEDIVVVNKPRGMVVHPSNGHYDGDTLVNALLYSIGDLSSINGVIRPGIVHRIDKNTSGLLVVAKNDEAHLFLSAQLQDHTMHREYYALVEGVIPHTDIKIDAPIGRSPKDRKKMAINRKRSQRPAETRGGHLRGERRGDLRSRRGKNEGAYADLLPSGNRTNASDPGSSEIHRTPSGRRSGIREEAFIHSLFRADASRVQAEFHSPEKQGKNGIHLPDRRGI